MTYINFWKQTFDYKNKSSFRDLLVCMFVNIIILVLIMALGVIVPITWENSIVNLYYIVLVLMIFPMIALIVRVIKNYK
ncbi:MULTISPECIES: hypothetical protein [Mammaliicoccus]|jgi:uncharacterized membrane protein YhaH (DUF805 family)|uniref:Uncharacterized protein n=5 Tax=Mammaliicoccus sciuri TaxID=1296 RepID=A0A1X0TXT5_MAMSC|nr:MULTISPECIES: hypothetical protein [Mammaliicoccus]CPQ88518.1 Uncharacterised protein [Staphylococcus aureus]ARB41017.1 hypothetical protein B5728_10400 [Mammaliicoccus sciuri]ASE34470.1 hypothetical protein CEP64_07705 [Mammaliicoccus sciuri]MBO1217918.1 hypothetical protein [Mammaliicoccus sciuri]MBO1230998.1 hypothetical protein [Mammaliicoccus sciuri]